MKLEYCARAIICALLIGLIPGGTLSASQSSKSKQPQRLRSASKLAKLLRDHQPKYLYNGPIFRVDGPTIDAVAAMNSPNAGAPQTNSGGSSSYSNTNIQVDGVDEADIVKTDGEYIYDVNNSRVLIIHAFPDTALAITATIAFESDFFPQELYVDANRLIVIGNAQRTAPLLKEDQAWPSPTAKAIVFDTTNKANPKQIREVEMDGYYISSRKIDQSIYLIARKYPDFFVIEAMGTGTTTGGDIGAGTVSKSADSRAAKRRGPRGLVPGIRDSAAGATYRKLDLRDAFYFPGFTEPDFLIVAGFNLDSDEVADIKAFLGAGDQVYASKDNLYVAASRFDYRPLILAPADPGAPQPDIPTESSTLYKFSLNKGAVEFSNRGEVPGTILNQFSMDESNGNFRIATTISNWGTGLSTNNLYVLNSNLEISGKLEGIAPGERIYATRFIGERCYMVTFRQIDPFFVIDLSNPASPAVVGELSLPGFSDYLQPYDDTHIIGIGRDTVNGFPSGVKLALFDVSDPSNPAQLFSTVAGDASAYSEALYNHKALLFDKTKNLLAFPITMVSYGSIPIDPVQPQLGIYWLPTYSFNGAYVYNVTLENGFTFKGGVTHLSGDAKNDWNYDLSIRRLLFIDENLYSVSGQKLKVNDLGTLNEKGALQLVPPPDTQPLPGAILPVLQQ